MKIATLAGALVLTAAMAAPALAEAGYYARPYVAYYRPYSPYRYGYYHPYRYYYYRPPVPYVYAPVRPYYRHRPRFHLGVWF